MAKSVKQQKYTHGQGFAEYALILALAVVIIVFILNLLGVSVRELYCAALTGLKVETNLCKSAYCESSFDSMDGWQGQSQAWAIQGGKLCNTSNPGSNFLYNQCSQKNLPSDYVVKVDGATLNSGNGYGVFFRLQNYNNRPNGYAFQYDPGLGGAFVVRKWVNGNEINPPLVMNRPPGYTWTGTPRDIEIRVIGNTYTAFVDGQQVLTFTDATYNSGGVGLRTWDSTKVCIDNLSINPVK
jgi:hypothetical protein